MSNDFSPERGVYLLKKIKNKQLALLTCPESEQRTAELEKFGSLEWGIHARMCTTPKGIAHLAFFNMTEGERLVFPDITSIYQNRGFFELVERFGEPDNLKITLSEHVAIEMVSIGFKSERAWLYVKYVCSHELGNGRDLPITLRRFVSTALFREFPKPSVGRKRSRNEYRDYIIASLSSLLKDAFGLPLSRGQDSNTESICRVIAETMSANGLSMTEDAIRKIIEKTDLSVNPIWNEGKN